MNLYIMHRYLSLIILTLLIGLYSCAQNGDYQYRGDEFYSYDEELNLYLEADYDSRSNKPDQYVYRLLKVFSNTDSGLREIQSKMLDDSCSDGRSYRFGEEYNTYSRKFVLIQGKFCFYIYDLRHRELRGAFSPFFWGTAEDEDKGEIRSLQITQNGKGVYGLSFENGCFYFNLSDLSKPRELIPYNLPFFSSNRVYMKPSEKNPDLYDVFFLYQEQGELFIDKMFSDLNLDLKDRSFLLNISEKEKEEMIMAATLEENRYTVFEEIAEQGKQYRVIDIFIGKPIDLPQDRYFSSREEVYEYLAE